MVQITLSMQLLNAEVKELTIERLGLATKETEIYETSPCQDQQKLKRLETAG